MKKMKINSRQSPTHRPTPPDSGVDSFCLYSSNFRPLSNRQISPLKIKKVIIPFIATLFFVGCPTTVLSRVMFAIIRPLKARVPLSKFFNVLEVGFIHIISEIFERFPKTPYSPTAIKGKISTILILTPGYHGMINNIKSGFTHAVLKQVVFFHRPIIS